MSPALRAPGAAVFGSAVLAAGLLPLTAGAAFATTPTGAQCTAYRAAVKDADDAGADLLAKEAAKNTAQDEVGQLGEDATEEEKNAVEEVLEAAKVALAKAVAVEDKARVEAKAALAVVGDPDACDGNEGGKHGHGKHGHGWQGDGRHGTGGGSSTGGSSTGGSSTGGSGIGEDQVAGARIEPGTSASTASVPAVDTVVGTVAPTDSSASVGSSQVAEVPSGAVEAGDGSTGSDHIGQALLGVGALGLGGGAGAAGAVMLRRRPA